MDGQVHIRLDLRNCPRIADLESRSPEIDERILEVAHRAGATVKEHHLRRFAPDAGYTLVVIIEESHFMVQTWPERAFVNIDVMVCNFTRDNSEIARRLARDLYEFFGGEVSFRDEIVRGPIDWATTS